MSNVSDEERRRWMRVVISDSQGDNQVIIHRDNHEPFYARIVDFSLGGLKLLCSDEEGQCTLPCPALKHGERLYIERCNVEPYCQLLSNLEVHVVWSSGDAVGCCFEIDNNCG